jgi:hypothetical protein
MVGGSLWVLQLLTLQVIWLSNLLLWWVLFQKRVMLTKIDLHHFFLTKCIDWMNFWFSNNYIIEELKISIINYFITSMSVSKHWLLVIGRWYPWELIDLQQRYHQHSDSNKNLMILAIYIWFSFFKYKMTLQVIWLSNLLLWWVLFQKRVMLTKIDLHHFFLLNVLIDCV